MSFVQVMLLVAVPAIGALPVGLLELRSRGGTSAPGWVILVGVSMGRVTDGLTIASGTVMNSIRAP